VTVAHLVIGVDESRGAAAALHWAVREAERRGWATRAVLAWGPHSDRHTLPDEWFDPNDVEPDARAALDAAVVRAVGLDAAQTVERQVVCGRAAPALIAASDGAELLVVGARGLGGFRRLMLGSVSDQCLHHAACPVAIVHANPATDRALSRGERPDRIVVGIDGSEDGQRALRWALDDARARDAYVQAVYAWQPRPVDGGYLYPGVPVDDIATPLPPETDRFEDAARHVLDAAVEGADISGLARPLQRRLVCGDAAAALLGAADDASLVVVGSRGMHGFRGLLLGSVSEQVAHHASCPVVVVRADER
jgi:nucleotide-binding universal stress UspA family protein